MDGWNPSEGAGILKHIGSKVTSSATRSSHKPDTRRAPFNPFTVTKGNNDPVLKELARLAQSDAQSQFSTPSEHVGNVDLTQFRKGSGQSGLRPMARVIRVWSPRGIQSKDAVAELPV